jgi:AcrR family transcriptional regulator
MGEAAQVTQEARAAMPVADRILDAAYEAFMADGYSGTSTLKIATRARASKRELYALFGSKEEILRACIARRASRMRLPQTPSTPRNSAELEGTLTALGTRLIEEICHPTVVAMHSLAVAEAGRSPELGQALERVREQIYANLSELIGRAQKAGLVQAGDAEDMGREFLMQLVSGLLIRLMQRVAQTPSPSEAKARAAHVAAMFMRLHGSSG